MHLIAALEKLSPELSLNSGGESSSLGCDVAKKQKKNYRVAVGGGIYVHCLPICCSVIA